MPHAVLTVEAGEFLVHVPDPARVPVVIDMVRPHDPTPRVVLGGHAYLVATSEAQARTFRWVVEAADLIDEVDLATESGLRLPVAEPIALQAKIRIAKVRASKLFAAMRATYRRAERREEHHGRLLAIGEELGSRAIASWQNEAFDTLTGWGDLEAFRTDPEYPGDVVCKTSNDDGAVPHWVRLPTDERILLEHGLDPRDREVATSVREARAHSLGIAELPRGPRR